MSNKLFCWILFIVLSIIWGSSFILMKIGMEKLSPYQVASLRILSAGLVLIPFAWKAWKQIPKKKMPVVVMSGLFGSFFPAFLYCLAETKIDTALAAILNSLTPVFAIIIGVSFFNLKITKQKIAGVIIGFIGLLLLPFAANKAINLSDVSYSALVLIATIFYGINVNMVSKH
ncbi:MAG: DMT family transporter, partial [Parafilimonas sp.]